MNASCFMPGGDATSAFFRTVRTNMNINEPVKPAEPRKSTYASMDKLIREMKLVEERHTIEQS